MIEIHGDIVSKSCKRTKINSHYHLSMNVKQKLCNEAKPMYNIMLQLPKGNFTVVRSKGSKWHQYLMMIYNLHFQEHLEREKNTAH